MTERVNEQIPLLDLLKNIEPRQWPGPIPPKIEMVYGSMFSGKTEEIMRKARRAEIAHFKVQIFKHAIDDRYKGINTVNSHSGGSLKATPVTSSREILENLNPDTNVLIIDEAQFFDEELPCIIETLSDKNMRIVLGGLLLDFKGEFFGPMPELMRIADQRDELFAICTCCGGDANRTQRMIKELQPNGEWLVRPAKYSDQLIVVGADESQIKEGTKREEFYEARCRRCHEVPR